MAAEVKQEEKKEVYGDPIRFRLASEYWRIMDDLQPKTLAALEFISETKQIDDTWRMTMQELGIATLELKYSILGFKSLLSKEDGETVRTYEACYALSLKREGRVEVPHGRMEGRAELYARRRLQLEDRAIALFYQTLDIRGVAFKNKMWDLTNRPQTKGHGMALR